MTVPAMYDDLAPWFHLLTPPAEYAEEASAIVDLLRASVNGPLETLLKLGSGGGNTASHLRQDLRVTLSDLSAPMLELSRTINPDAEHIAGDMRTLRLGRTFDAVLIHDAICYMTTEGDMRAAFTTAHEHLRPGGAAIFAPDHVRERFHPDTNHGGEDGPTRPDGLPGRAMRYLEWTTDPDPTDSTYQVDFALLLRDTEGAVTVRHDRHIEGLFSTETWLAVLESVGLTPSAHDDQWERTVFVGRRPV